MRSSAAQTGSRAGCGLSTPDIHAGRRAPLLVLVALCVFGAPGSASAGAAQTARSPEPAETGAPSKLTLDSFRTADAPCYDRSVQPYTAVVDTHVHFRPFGGPAVPFAEILGYFEATGVLFANVYGIGQMLPASSSCTYYLDCPGTPVTPTVKNDFVNAADVVTKTPEGLHLTLAMTFPDLADPRSVLDGMALLDAEYPGLFRWMGEVNLVKQALFDNGHEPVPADAIAEWTGFMEALRDRGIPLAIHSDLGSDRRTDPLPPTDGGGAPPVSGQRDRVGPHGSVARAHHDGSSPSRRPDDLDAGAPSRT